MRFRIIPPRLPRIADSKMDGLGEGLQCSWDKNCNLKHAAAYGQTIGKNLEQIFSLNGKKALVTGGSRGIGNRLAKALHDAGAEIVIFYNNTCAEELSEKITGDGPAVHAVKCNVSQRAELEEAIPKVLALLDGRIDILVNAAGINRRYNLEDFPADEWDQVIATNLTGAVYCTQLVGRVMLRQGYGRIINLASMNSFVSGKRVGAYVAFKGAIGQMTKAFANEWGDRGIRVNALARGYIMTDMTEALVKDEASYHSILTRIPEGRWGTPDDLAGPVVFLASDEADYVNGIPLPVDGGYLAR